MIREEKKKEGKKGEKERTYSLKDLGTSSLFSSPSSSGEEGKRRKRGEESSVLRLGREKKRFPIRNFPLCNVLSGGKKGRGEKKKEWHKSD